MRPFITLSALLYLAVCDPYIAMADPARAGRNEVVARVMEAAALIRNEGEAAFGVIADPDAGYLWKDTYVFAVNCDADRVMANPAFPERVGGDIKQHTDYAGKQYGRELCRAAAQPSSFDLPRTKLSK